MSRRGEDGGRLLRLVLRLYPGDFRRRHAERIAETLREEMASVDDDRERARIRRRVLLDALATLPRAWSRGAGRRDGGTYSKREGWKMGSLVADARFALRHVRRHPLHGAVVVGTLALTLAAVVAIGSVTWAVLVRSLPYSHPERVLALSPAPAYFSSRGVTLDPELAEVPQVEAAALYLPDGGANLTPDGVDATRIRVAQVSGDFFRVLGVSMALGAGLPNESDQPDAIVLSHGLWLRIAGGDPDIVGRSVRLNGRDFRVAGVAPAEVGFPDATEAWLPLPELPELYGNAFGPSVVARLRQGATAAPVRTYLDERTAAQYADVGSEYGPPPATVVTPLRRELSSGVRTPLLVLLGASAMILLLGCLNLAGMGLARVVDRKRELGTRAALGASGGQLLRQLLVESLLLAAGGGGLGVLLAAGGVHWLRTLLPAETPGLAAATVGGPALAGAFLVTLAAGILVGALPALAARRASSVASPRGQGRGPGAVRGQDVLVLGQMALALTLSAGALLLSRSLGKLRDVPLGFDTGGVLTFQVQLPDTKYPDPSTTEAYLNRALARLGAVPGVTAVGASTRLPLAAGMSAGRRVRAADDAEGDGLPLIRIEATEGWLRAMGTRVIQGRGPGEEKGDQGAVISASAARTLFGTETAVGRMIAVRGYQGWGSPIPVVGVIEEMKLRGPEQDTPTLWAPLQASPFLGFALRTGGDAARLAPAVRAALAEVDPGVPPFELRTIRTAVSAHVAARAAVARLSALFGGASMLLAALGLYGLLARGVAVRRREMGIRLALGADGPRLVRSVVGRGLRLASLGAVVGLILAVLLTGYLDDLLYQVDARDPATLAAVTAGALLLALASAWLPARRVAALDPREAILAEGE